MTNQKIKKTITALCILLVILAGIYFLYSIIKVIKQEHNQKMAYQSLKQVSHGQKKYFEKNKKYANLATLAQSGLVDSRLTQPESNGYYFSIKLNHDGYEITATPLRAGVFATGLVSYFIDQSGIIRGDRKMGLKATKMDPPLPEP